MDNLTSKHNKIDSLTLMLGASSALCIVLLALRIHFSSSSYYAFFVWNLFLAWIPLLVSQTILHLEKQGKSNVMIASLFFMWLVFFPNSPYILTDLFHLRKVQNVPLWYDLILIVSFAWNGLMIGYISLLNIQTFLNRKYNHKMSWAIILLVLFLSAFGVYLGRFERWNSWDVIANPFALFSNILEKIINPFSHPKTMGVTLFFSLFLTSGYLTLYHLIKSPHYEK